MLFRLFKIILRTWMNNKIYLIIWLFYNYSSIIFFYVAVLTILRPQYIDVWVDFCTWMSDHRAVIMYFVDLVSLGIHFVGLLNLRYAIYFVSLSCCCLDNGKIKTTIIHSNIKLAYKSMNGLLHSALIIYN